MSKRNQKLNFPPHGKRKFLDRVAIFFLKGCALVALSLWSLNKLLHAWRTPNGKLIIMGLGLLVVASMALRLGYRFRKRRRHRAEIRKVKISDNRRDYLVELDDYRRGNPKEGLYRKSFQLSLLEVYGNRCAKCSSNDNGLDVDHLFMSKNEGGCFIMRHRKGHLVNNAIPLCQSCNRSKSDKSYLGFFSSMEVLAILQRNTAMTKLLNEKGVIDRNGVIVKQKRRSPLLTL